MTVDSWTVVDEATGKHTNVTLSRRKRRGRKPKVATIRSQLVKSVPHRAPRGSVRLMIGDQAVSVFAGRPAGDPFTHTIERHHRLLAKRGHVLAADVMPPLGQAGLWYQDSMQCVPRSGQRVARQIARLCGDDSQVCVPIRSLADAVGVRDKAGRTVSYTETGIRVLVEAGWLSVRVTGLLGAQQTTYYLEPGDR